MGFLDVLGDLFDDVLGLFGDDEEYSQDAPPQWPAPQVVTGYVGPPASPSPPAPPQVPGGPNGMQAGADQAGTQYQQTSGAVSDTDDKVNALLKEVLASNSDARSQVSGIIGNIKAAQQQLVTDPSKARDPHSLAYFNQYLDQQLGRVEQVLDSAKVDSKKQAELLSALGDEYRKNSPGQGGDSKDQAGSQGSGDQSGGSGGASGGGSDQSGGSGGGSDQSGGSGGAAGGGGVADPGAGGAGVADPFAGLGGLGGLGGGDPLTSMLGPAMSALGSLPGALGGAGASLPASALGALGDQFGNRDGGSSDGFSDRGSHDGDHGKSDFHDGDNDEVGHDSGSDGSSNGGSAPAHSDNGSADQPQPQPAPQPASSAAVPASAASNPALVVQMPDGSPVTATTVQHAGALRAVMGGASVFDGWKQNGTEIAPPGTPVTSPGDPSRLVPGEYAQYKSRDPVMYAGNDKIWLDGQLQPKSALPTEGFLGWVDPGAQASAPTAPANTPAAPTGGAPVLTATNG